MITHLKLEYKREEEEEKAMITGFVKGNDAPEEISQSFELDTGVLAIRGFNALQFELKAFITVLIDAYEMKSK